VSGLPFVYLLKSLIPLFALLMALAGIAQAIRAALVLTSPLSSPAQAGDPATRAGDDA